MQCFRRTMKSRGGGYLSIDYFWIHQEEGIQNTRTSSRGLLEWSYQPKPTTSCKEEWGSTRESCRMHDVIHHLAIDKAEIECFSKVDEGNWTFSTHGTRRLSTQSLNIVPKNQLGATHLCAVYVFASFVDIDLLRTILASSKLLSTLDLHGTRIKKLPNEVFSLFNLRFLGFRNTQVESLSEAVGRSLGTCIF